MNHKDHVNLLRRAIPEGTPGPWADFGSGDGAFTLALRDLVGPQVEIFSVEKDEARLDQQQRNFLVRFPESNIQFLHQDFTRPLGLAPLDGLIMANSIHYFRNKERLLEQFRGYLKPGGRLVLVEYNTDSGNPWVPYPLSFETFHQVAVRAGYAEPQLLETVPSHFLGQIYSAVAFAPANRGK